MWEPKGSLRGEIGDGRLVCAHSRCSLIIGDSSHWGSNYRNVCFTNKINLDQLKNIATPKSTQWQHQSRLSSIQIDHIKSFDCVVKNKAHLLMDGQLKQIDKFKTIFCLHGYEYEQTTNVHP